MADLAAADHRGDPGDGRAELSVAARTALPLVEVGVAGAGRAGTPGARLIGTSTGAALRYGCVLVSVFRRSGGDPDADSAPAARTLSLPPLSGRQAEADLHFPRNAQASALWDAEAGELTVTLPRAGTARLFRLTPIAAARRRPPGPEIA